MTASLLVGGTVVLLCVGIVVWALLYEHGRQDTYEGKK